MLVTIRSFKRVCRRPFSINIARWQTNQVTSNFDQKRNPRDVYFSGNPRYKLFCKHNAIMQRIDRETQQIIPWIYVNTKADNAWEHVPAYCDNACRIDAFEKMLAYSESSGVLLSDTRFDAFIDLFTIKIESFTVDELLRSLQLFAKHPIGWQSCRQRNFLELFLAFDQQSTILASHLTTDSLLFLCSIWMRIPNANESFTATHACRIFNRSIKTMTARQLVPVLYYITCLRRVIDDFGELELVLEQTIEEMSVEELAIVAWTFERSDSLKFDNSHLRTTFFNHLEQQNVDHLDDVLMRSIFLVGERRIVSRWKNRKSQVFVIFSPPPPPLL